MMDKAHKNMTCLQSFIMRKQIVLQGLSLSREHQFYSLNIKDILKLGLVTMSTEHSAWILKHGNDKHRKDEGRHVY